MVKTIAPGARILCRDAEWLVKSTAQSSDGGRVIEAVGVSEFIRGRTARFIEQLEDDLQVLRPEETELIADTSSGYVHSLLFIVSFGLKPRPVRLSSRPKPSGRLYIKSLCFLHISATVNEVVYVRVSAKNHSDQVATRRRNGWNTGSND